MPLRSERNQLYTIKAQRVTGAIIPALCTGSHQNSAVKRAWARVVLGWVTSWEVLVLHPSFLPCASNRTSPSILFFCCSSSPTLCARAVTWGFPPQRCLRWGPPLVGFGPLRIIVEFQRSLEICFLTTVAKVISSAPT